jgi:2-keto-myo-inositol isomerase
MVAPRLNHAAFFDLARKLGVESVEIRNDLKGVALLDGSPAADVSAAAKARGLRILSINALQRFNLWDEARAAEAASLVAQAVASGAGALVLCPVNDVNYTPSPAERRDALREALNALKPILSSAGVVGLVEPLGFAESSLRTKEEAVDAIEAIGGVGAFRLVHDTFHHFVAGETKMFPQRTGLVHISGVTDASATAATMRDPHRVLVDAGDRIGNLAQLRALRAGGYSGAVSFEPFAASVHDSPTIEADLRASLAYVKAGLEQGRPAPGRRAPPRAS